MDSEHVPGMLVLSRKQYERIIIGDGADAIVVTVTDIDRMGNKCRVGIIAPKHTAIMRGELRGTVAEAGIRERAAKEKEGVQA
jgi:carbon storage regulator CsrA